MLRIDIGEELIRVEDDLLDAHLFQIEAVPIELEEIAQFIENGQAPEGMSTKEKQILAMNAAPYTLINGFLYKMGLDEVLCWCVLEHERENIIIRGNFNSKWAFKL